jgi:hypothetical protein
MSWVSAGASPWPALNWPLRLHQQVPWSTVRCPAGFWRSPATDGFSQTSLSLMSLCAILRPHAQDVSPKLSHTAGGHHHNNLCELWVHLCSCSRTGGLDSRWCRWNFSLTWSFRPRYVPGVDSASNRNEYQEYFLGGKGGRCVGLTTLLPSCADCLEIWEPQPPGTLSTSPGL